MTTPRQHERTSDSQLSRRAFLVRSGLAVAAGTLWPCALEGAVAPGPSPLPQGPAEQYRFALGDMRCVALNDGTVDYSAAKFFANAPAAELASVLAAYHTTPAGIPTPVTFLLVDASRRRVLVDAGWGVGDDPRVGHLRANLSVAGLDPASVDTVILTHAHPDHIGGLVAGDGTPVFPNAEYVIGEREWGFWSDEANLAKQPAMWVRCVRHNLLPLQHRLTLVSGEREVVPGVQLLATPGHTPGHMVVAVMSRGKMLLFISDAALHPVHLARPDWYTSYDMDRELAAESRRRLFDRAADERALILATHFEPFPSLGHVSHKGGGWVWEPIDAPGTQTD